MPPLPKRDSSLAKGMSRFVSEAELVSFKKIETVKASCLVEDPIVHLSFQPMR